MTDLTPPELSGGFPDMVMPTDPILPVEPAPVLPPAAQKIVIGNKVFDSSEEALAYANGLAEYQSKSQNTTAQAAAPTTASGVKLGQLLFEDPEQALAQVKAQAVAEMRNEQRGIEENRKFWEDFYTKNSDLRGSELLVDAVLGREQHLGSMNGMSRTDAAPILAAKARQEVSKIRNVPSGGTALPSTPAMVAGSSGTSTPQVQVPKPAATNFVTEMRNLRKRG